MMIQTRKTILSAALCLMLGACGGGGGGSADNSAAKTNVLDQIEAYGHLEIDGNTTKDQTMAYERFAPAVYTVTSDHLNRLDIGKAQKEILIKFDLSTSPSNDYVNYLDIHEPSLPDFTRWRSLPQSASTSETIGLKKRLPEDANYYEKGVQMHISFNGKYPFDIELINQFVGLSSDGKSLLFYSTQTQKYTYKLLSPLVIRSASSSGELTLDNNAHLSYCKITQIDNPPYYKEIEIAANDKSRARFCAVSAKASQFYLRLTGAQAALNANDQDTFKELNTQITQINTALRKATGDNYEQLLKQKTQIQDSIDKLVSMVKHSVISYTITRPDHNYIYSGIQFEIVETGVPIIDSNGEYLLPILKLKNFEPIKPYPQATV
ncbi:MAG: hypothetical protein O2809_02705 [Proteobacteria bacterium]|nr:hypothetical protein [Pseudomonadota bacterium]